MRACWLLWIGMILCAATSVRADDDLTVLKPQEGQPPPAKMLYSYLEQQAKQLLEARRKEVAALKTPEQITERQKKLRERFWQTLGDMPEKTPLNARVVGTLERDGIRVEKVIYESRPGHHVTGNVYIPAGKPPFPGVIVPCGHSANGKAAEPYQLAAILLAKNGMLALCYDPIGQGERIQLLDDKGKPVINGSTNEHTMAGVGAWLVGRSAASYRVWDGIRSLDYLESRPDVDPKRLGCTGNSGGGTMTAYLMALDDRIAAAAPSCYITSLERLFATIGPQDAEQNITGQVAFGMDHADYLEMRAPKPTLMCVGTRDYFDIQGAWDSFREAKLLYGRLGYGDRMDLFESDETHGFTPPRRIAAMRWLRRWLVKEDDEPLEGELQKFTDAELQCTKSGQVLTEFHGKSVFDLNRERSQELAKKREEARKTQSLESFQKALRRLIGLKKAIPRIQARLVERLDRGDYTVDKIVFETEPGIRLPARYYYSDEAAKDAQLRIIVTSDRATETPLAEDLIRDPIFREDRFLMVDVRGFGETSPQTPGDVRPSLFGLDAREAFLSIQLDMPLLGQRVYDLLTIVEAMRGERSSQILVSGIGSAAPIVLHAAALDSRIKTVVAADVLMSWSDVAESGKSVKQLANVVPGALAVYDLPDLLTAIAPRSATITDPKRANGETASAEEARELYATARRSYLKDNAAARLSVRVGHTDIYP